MIEKHIQANTEAVEANTAAVIELTALMKESREAAKRAAAGVGAKIAATEAEKPTPDEEAPAKKAPAKKAPAKKAPAKKAPAKKAPAKEEEPVVEAEETPVSAGGDRENIKTLDQLRAWIRKTRVDLRKANDNAGLQAFKDGFDSIKEENCYDKLNEIPEDELPEFIADVLDLRD